MGKFHPQQMMGPRGWVLGYYTPEGHLHFLVHPLRLLEAGWGLMQWFYMVAGLAGIDILPVVLLHQKHCGTSQVLWIPGWQDNFEAWAHWSTFDPRAVGRNKQPVGQALEQG